MALIPIPSSGWVSSGSSLSDWSTFVPPDEFIHNPSISWSAAYYNQDVVDQVSGFKVSARVLLQSGVPLAGLAFRAAANTFNLMVDARNGATGSSASIHLRRDFATAAFNTVAGSLNVTLDNPYYLEVDVLGDQLHVVLIDTVTDEVISDTTITVTISGWTGITKVGISGHQGVSIYDLRVGMPSVKASDQVTLQVLPTPSYVRQYYLLQSSTLNPPAAPTVNPPVAPWSTIEPNYTAGSTDTLYTVMITAWGDGYFEYGPVQKSSSYEAAKEAYNLATAAQTLAATADGRITISTAAPTTGNGAGKPNGAVWYQRNGSNQWVGMWEWTGSAWASRTITNAMIATLDAAKINTGTLSADRIGANSISAAKLAIGDFTNYAINGDFRSGKLGWGGTGTVITSSTEPNAYQIITAATGNNDQPNDNVFEVDEGEQYFVSYEVWADPAITTFNSVNVHLAITRYTLGSSWPNVPLSSTRLEAEPGVWIPVSGIITIPEDSRYAKVEMAVGGNNVAGNTYRFRNIVVRHMVAGEVIVDGTITTNKLNALSVTADKIAVAAIDATKLQAGSVIAEKLAVDSVTAASIAAGAIRANHIEAGSINVTHVSPSFGSDIVLDGNVIINAIQAQTQAAQDSADANAQDLAEMQQVYSFGPTGAIISSPGEVFSLALRNDKIEMLENGNAISYWNSGQMFVAQLIAEKLTMGNHQIERLNNGTVVRDL